jgi:O-antigen/teichoic acid export membrane protein
MSVIYIGFFPSNFLMVKYSALGKDKISRYLSNIFIMIGITFFVVLLALYGLKDTIFSTYEDNALLILYITLLCLFQVFWQILSTIIQLEKDALKYALFQFILVAVTIGLALLLIIDFSWGWKGKFFAELIVYGFSALYAFFYLRKNGYIHFDYDFIKIKELTSYLFPLTFFVLGLFIMGTVDKIFIANMISLEAAGVYAIAVTMTIIVNMVFDAVLKAWEPYMYELLNSQDKEDRVKVVKATYVYWLFVVLFAGIYIVLMPYLFSIMIDDKFNNALLYIPILVIGYSFEGLRKPISGFLNHIDKVNLNAVITIIAAIINIILNYFLINQYGIIGAAYATLIAFASLYFMTIIAVFKTCDLPWSLKR